LNCTISLLLPLDTQRTGEEGAAFPCVLLLPLSTPLAQETRQRPMPTQALPPRHNDEKSQGSYALRATPQLTLPCVMIGVRWPFPPPPINSRGRGAERRGGEKEREGDQQKEKKREKEGKPRKRDSF